MSTQKLVGSTLAGALIGLVSVVFALAEDPAKAEVTDADPSGTGTTEISIGVARDRAIVTQDIYAATLHMLHERYFHRDKKVLPARAMQDIFDDIDRQSNVKTRWISASLKPMSIDHAPESEFEKQAAKEIAKGTASVEVVEGGYYRRAIAIPLTGGCLGCHEGMFRGNGRKKFAGLVVSMPLRIEADSAGESDK